MQTPINKYLELEFSGSPPVEYVFAIPETLSYNTRSIAEAPRVMKLIYRYELHISQRMFLYVFERWELG